MNDSAKYGILKAQCTKEEGNRQFAVQLLNMVYTCFFPIIQERH